MGIKLPKEPNKKNAIEDNLQKLTYIFGNHQKYDLFKLLRKWLF